jgi:hypothetical protein
MDRGSQKRVIAGGFGGDYLSIETVFSPICRAGKEAAAKLLDKAWKLNYNACQAITG